MRAFPPARRRPKPVRVPAGTRTPTGLPTPLLDLSGNFPDPFQLHLQVCRALRRKIQLCKPPKPHFEPPVGRLESLAPGFENSSQLLLRTSRVVYPRSRSRSTVKG